MRTAVLALLLAATLLSHPAFASQGGGSLVASAQATRLADAAVLKHSAIVLGIPVGRLQVDRPYANQAVAGDALDIVEIIMAIEDDLDITIDDDAINAAVGASGVADIAKRLTIAKLQQVVRRILAQKTSNSF